ncbi:phosphomannomutase [Actinopolymorpha cephalotaxi]|uniref:Phosphomannomutase n=1 Tax=Actinopolymorpha cephalotaxi TaxID=504797 RepID=A0A1I2KX08_9ACTN|nr:phospho-sugar mutase [Actinopolymorpha cephalotaxi]NYH84617.1 phosphomannomutase [Actinopolymorpha cephalotaxi]SFF69446.1 phosphomannomutase [Actinopolymorpha cephalotaxi]
MPTTETRPDLLEQARAWLAEDPDPQTRAELSELIAAADAGDGARDGAGDGDDGSRFSALAELADRFAGPLTFGTAGLRGALGAGPNRMNRAVVIRAAAGLAAYLRTEGATDGAVVIGYDARRNSDIFAADTAAVLAGAGLRPLVLPEPLPTPVLAFAIRQLGCVAGVMVTASHNPPQDNGYKVYLGDGSQIVPPADIEIAAAIASVGPLADVPREQNWETLGPEILEAYLDRAAGLLGPGPRDVSIAYTPLHGVGGAVVRAALDRAGFAEPEVVAAQAEPDPAFPTVAFPNPEEPGAMDLAFELAGRTGADVVLANDPDADRCAVGVPTADGVRMLTGDEVGALLAVHLLDSGARGTLATTIVSSSLLGVVAARRGEPYAETLTGFKWIGRVPGLAFGYEEALGYCVDPAAVADKDGITALLRVAELVAAQKQAGRTLLDLLDDIAREYGLHVTAQHSVRVSDLSQIDATLHRLHTHPPEVLGGRPVERVDDLSEPGADSLPGTPGVRYVLAGGARVVIRPSGTEPKLKCYLEVVVAEPGADLARARADADAGMRALLADLATLVA